jgi:hypothetical protein
MPSCHLKKLGVGGRTKLNWFWKKYDVIVWAEVMWFSTKAWKICALVNAVC